MKPVRIITDTGSDIDVFRDARVTVLPLSIAFGSVTYRDGVDITKERFYEMLESGDELPTTSQVTPHAFIEALDAAKAAGEEVVIVTVASALSGTYNSALMAAEGREDVYVVDSASATVGQCALIEYALGLLDEGLNAQQIAERLEEQKQRVIVLAVLDTLEFLRRGGRVPAAAGAIGELLRVKPVLGIEDGEVKLLGRARGAKNGRNLLRQQIEKLGVDFSRPVVLGHTGTSDELLRTYLDESRELWEDNITQADMIFRHVGAAIGTHVGPGAIAVAFFRQA